jgi:hypothetical protein
MKPSVRLFAVIGAAVVLTVLLLSSLPSSASASDKDCSDFPTQRAAQFFFLKHGGPRFDPDRLDADNDGVACEDNPCPCYYKKRLPRRAESSDLIWERLQPDRL